jgi:hypothetical protein
MNITPQMTLGMTSDEQQIFFDHMAMRHRQEAEKLEAEKMALRSYKLDLIDDILRLSDKFNRDSLLRLSTRTLERIFDNI